MKIITWFFVRVHNYYVCVWDSVCMVAFFSLSSWKLTFLVALTGWQLEWLGRYAVELWRVDFLKRMQIIAVEHLIWTSIKYGLNARDRKGERMHARALHC